MRMCEDPEEPEDDLLDEDDELGQRLRAVEWPKPPPGLAEKSLREFERRLAEGEIEEDEQPARRCDE